MNEQETELIREYVHIHYLIQEAILEISHLKNSYITLSSILTKYTKSLGRHLRNKQYEVQRELRKHRIQVWIEDNAEEVIFICTNKNGVKGRHGMKRRILYEDMDRTLQKYSDEIIHEPKHVPYKPAISAGDPYASTYAK